VTWQAARWLVGGAGGALLAEVRDAELCEVLGLTGDDRHAPRARDTAFQCALWSGRLRWPNKARSSAPSSTRSLCELDALRRHGTERMVELEAPATEHRHCHVCASALRSFRWYIEVSRSNRQPSGRISAQATVASGERYTLPRVDELADKISHAEDRHRDRELLLLRELVERAGQETSRVAALSERLSGWDVVRPWPTVAPSPRLRRPKVDESERCRCATRATRVRGALSARGKFVPNDVELDRRASACGS